MNREVGENVADLLRQILAEATALKHVGTRTTKPYAEAIVARAEWALDIQQQSLLLPTQ